MWNPIAVKPFVNDPVILTIIREGRRATTFGFLGEDGEWHKAGKEGGEVVAWAKRPAPYGENNKPWLPTIFPPPYNETVIMTVLDPIPYVTFGLFDEDNEWFLVCWECKEECDCEINKEIVAWAPMPPPYRG